MNPTWFAVLLAMVIFFGAGVPAQAQQSGSSAGVGESAPTLKPPPEPERPESGATDALQWSDAWSGIRAWEYPVASALMIGGFSARFLVRPPAPNWVGTSDFEQGVLDHIAVRENPGNENIRRLSDLGFYGAMAYRLVDSALLPGLLHPNSWHVAWKMSWIDFESLAVVSAVEWGTQIFVGRVRPSGVNCDDPHRIGHICDRQDPDYARSFVAGHTATATAVAGLTCLHHDRLPLYGGGVADKLACAFTVANALGNGVARVVSERHYPSDALLGWGLGIAAGWVLPRVLHYGWGEPDPAERVGLPEPVRQRRAFVFQVSPTLVDARPGLLVIGRF